MELGLRGKRAFVSGATRGIGLEVARALAEEGVWLHLVSSNEERLRSVAETLCQQHPIKCDWSVADYYAPGSAAAAAQRALDALGGVDILVNNAGRSQPGDLDSPEADWKASYQLNFLSHLEAMTTLLPGMKQTGWGRIVNISGMAFRQPATINMGTAAKFALLSTSKALSREVASSGVTVNAVTVGLVETHQINEIYFRDADQRQQLADRDIPMGRFGHPSEVAPAVLFLASEQAAYITGSTITVDGGMTHGV